MKPDLEAMARTLENSGSYRVLRKLVPRRTFNQPDGSALRLGIFLDVETTGLDPALDEIIELAMVPFTFNREGVIFEIGEIFEGLRQPAVSIPAEITALTGIDDAMVAGQTIDKGEVARFIEPANLILAHNAAFDRRFVERLCDEFALKPWGCSQSQVPWKEEGFDGTKLNYLLAGVGLFHDAHRALSDCQAALEILARPLPKSGRIAFKTLLENARKPLCRVWAERSPIESKDILKARGYRWNDGTDGRPKSWWRDVDEDRCDAELAFLGSKIYQGDVDIPVQRITAVDRFSDRG
jgi:DNA polymerase-3 subunit epsilon